MKSDPRKKIIFWLPSGRLGNLIFQSQAALRLFADDCKVISPENVFTDVFETNELFKFIYVPYFIKHVFVFFWFLFFEFLVKLKVIGSIKPLMIEMEGYCIESSEIVEQVGFFSSFWTFQGFFQHCKNIEPVPSIRKSFLKDAEQALINIPFSKRVAVHMRFGDYTDFPVFGIKGAVLPEKFYHSAILAIRHRVPEPMFIIFTDDIQKAKNIFKSDGNFIYLDKSSVGFDISAMSLCSHAIISASTFAWWGAMLIKAPNRIVYAPKYWTGFKSRKWFPKDIASEYFEYIDIDSI